VSRVAGPLCQWAQREKIIQSLVAQFPHELLCFIQESIFHAYKVIYASSDGM
jgi:hypothetical protein